VHRSHKGAPHEVPLNPIVKEGHRWYRKPSVSLGQQSGPLKEVTLKGLLSETWYVTCYLVLIVVVLLGPSASRENRRQNRNSSQADARTVLHSQSLFTGEPCSRHIQSTERATPDLKANSHSAYSVDQFMMVLKGEVT
jgi:hypothetical protein